MRQRVGGKGQGGGGSRRGIAFLNIVFILAAGRTNPPPPPPNPHPPPRPPPGGRQGEVEQAPQRGKEGGGIGHAGGTAGVEAVRSAAERHGVSPQRVALAWLLSLGPTVIPIPGARRPETITDSLAAPTLRLEDEELGAITAAVSG